MEDLLTKNLFIHSLSKPWLTPFTLKYALHTRKQPRRHCLKNSQDPPAHLLISISFRVSRRGWGEKWNKFPCVLAVGCTLGEQHTIMFNGSRIFLEQCRRIALWEINDIRGHFEELLVNGIIIESYPTCFSYWVSEREIWEKMIVWIIILPIAKLRMVYRILRNRT